MTSESTEGDEVPAPYDVQLASLKATRPTCTALLERAQENRSRRLARLAGGARLEGLEELLAQLMLFEASYRSDSRLAKVAMLVARTTACFAIGLEASLAGMHTVVHDAMRVVMEVEFLLRDFALEPSHVDEWLTWDEGKRRAKFDPGVLRRRHADRVGKKPSDMSEATDYKGHSQALHVTPRPAPFGAPGIADDGDPWGSDVCFWEMYEHARRVLWSIYHFAKEHAPEAHCASPDDFSAFRRGWERTMEMQSIFMALVTAASEPSDDEST